MSGQKTKLDNVEKNRTFNIPKEVSTKLIPGTSKITMTLDHSA